MTSDRKKPTRNIGNYRLIAHIGQGGMASVYLGLSRKAGGFSKLLVLKVMRDEIANDPEFRTMFLDEATIAARLSHPNVVQVFEVGEDDGRFFIAMEYVEGQSFSAFLNRSKRDPKYRSAYLRVLSDALLGLHHAHELTNYDGTPLSLVHRDVSPPNLLIAFSGHAKIVDFGIAKIASSPVQTKVGTLKGKIGYMAPEQVRGEALDRRADIFAVGVMLWETLAGRALVPRTDSEVAALARRLGGTEPNVEDVAPDAPPELVAICKRAMAFHPADRYPTALEMQRELEVYLATQPGADHASVAERLTELFDEERKALKAVIEQHVTKADEELPLAHVRTGLQLSPDATPSPRDPSGDEATPNPTRTLPREAPRRSRVGLGLGLALALGVAAVAGVMVWKAKRAPAPDPTPVTAAPEASTTAAHVASSTATEPPPPSARPHLAVKTEPGGATILLDGRPTPNPLRMELEPGSEHHLVVEAPGYRKSERTLTMTSDVTLEIALVRAAPTFEPRPSRPTAPPPATARPTGKPEPTNGKPPKRPIDDENPY